MILHNVTQGTTEWSNLRAGIPTASAFDRIVTKSGAESTQAEKYLHQLIAERLLGRPIVEFQSAWMDRGKRLEAEALLYYEALTGVSTTEIGFVTNDAGTIGASPDRFVGSDGLLEIKAPKDTTHAGYLLTGVIEQEYKPQAQGQLWIAEREWNDIVSYHPEMPPAVIRVYRDDIFLKKAIPLIEAFARRLAEKVEECIAREWIKPQTVPGGTEDMLARSLHSTHAKGGG